MSAQFRTDFEAELLAAVGERNEAMLMVLA